MPAPTIDQLTIADDPARWAALPGFWNPSPLVDPVMQVLVLTDVVIEATVVALLLALVVQAHKRFGSIDPAELRALRG